MPYIHFEYASIESLICMSFLNKYGYIFGHGFPFFGVADSYNFDNGKQACNDINASFPPLK